MNKKILRLAIPNILSNLSVPLLSTVDTALMGRQESAAYIGAVAIGSLIFNFIYWSFGFLRMGTTGLTAQAMGENNKPAMANILGRALVTAIAGALMVLLLQIPLAGLSFGILDASTEVEGFAKEYFFTRIWAAPATMALYAFMGWFFGMQNAIYPLILTVVINVVNIVCNLYFVNKLGMKADGVALGTVIAQYSGLVLAFGLFRYRYYYLVEHLSRKVIFEWAAFKRFLALNRDIFIRTFCLIFAFAFFDNQSAVQGDLVLAVNSILLQFVNWMSYGIDGFAYASESLIGKYIGAKDKHNLQKAIRTSFIWAMGFAALYAAFYWLLGESLLHIFTDQEEIIAMASGLIGWMVLFPLIATPSYIWDGVYIGFTASTAMRNAMIISLVIYLTVYYGQLHFFDWGNNGLWFSLLAFMAARGCVQWVVYNKTIKGKWEIS